MQIYYSIRIEANRNIHDSISRILMVDPTKTKNYWEYEITFKDEYKEGYNLSQLIKLLTPSRIKQLENLGIPIANISIWIVVEYEDQCNLFFPNKELKDIANLGIDLCISCYEY